jgi:hypothetical protein
MDIIGLMNKFFSSIFYSERSKFREYVKQKGGDNVQRTFEEFRDSEAYTALRLVFETVCDNVRKRLTEVSPANTVEIAVCQAFAHLDTLLDISVTNLSTLELQKEIDKILNQAKNIDGEMKVQPLL